ncbi:MAG: phage head-tail joining protein [Methylocella sp.]|jgi:hypothetical protein
MPDTVASLQAALDALNAARALGASVVSYVANGVQRSVTYKSDIEMNAAAQDLSRRITALQGGYNRTIKLASSKGLGRRGDRDEGGFASGDD